MYSVWLSGLKPQDKRNYDTWTLIRKTHLKNAFLATPVSWYSAYWADVKTWNVENVSSVRQ